MAGHAVFPGGRIEPGDQTWAEAAPESWQHAAIDRVPDLDTVSALAHCLGAIRETLEEAGVLLARTASGAWATNEQAHAARDAIVRGTSLASVLAEARLVPDVDALIPLAWWITPEGEGRRFDTRFFLAVAPPHDATPDHDETVAGAWFTPRAALDAYATGALVLAPPTFATLEDLAASIHDDDTLWQPRPLRPILPVRVAGAFGPLIALPGDALHTDPTPVWPHRTRIVMTASGRFVSSRPSRDACS